MKSLAAVLDPFVGSYAGSGINHEGLSFAGRFELSRLLDGRGFQIHFTARSTASAHEIYHTEVSSLANNCKGGISLFNLNSNIPFLAEHPLVAEEDLAGGRKMIFRFGVLEDKSSFREEVHLHLKKVGGLEYHYYWGLPGGQFTYRSGVTLQSDSAKK